MAAAAVIDAQSTEPVVGMEPVSGTELGKDIEGNVWNSVKDLTTGDCYYRNVTTNESGWDPPEIIAPDPTTVMTHQNDHHHLALKEVLADVVGEALGRDTPEQLEEIKYLRHEVNEFLEAKPMQAFLIFLALLEMVIIEIELLMADDADGTFGDAVINFGEGPEEVQREEHIHHVLHMCSQIILITFTVEAVLSIWALRCE